MQINIHEAKTRLSKLIELSLLGEEIIIAKSGKPLVKLEPCNVTRVMHRTPNMFRGKVNMLEGFDELPQEFLSFFNRQTK